MNYSASFKLLDAALDMAMIKTASDTVADKIVKRPRSHSTLSPIESLEIAHVLKSVGNIAQKSESIIRQNAKSIGGTGIENALIRRKAVTSEVEDQRAATKSIQKSNRVSDIKSKLSKIYDNQNKQTSSGSTSSSETIAEGRKRKYEIFSTNIRSGEAKRKKKLEGAQSTSQSRVPQPQNGTVLVCFSD
jgi:hypothetical protein